MNETFQGRPVLAGSCSGETLVSHQGVNMLASFQKSVILRSKTATCSDQNNPDLYGRLMTGKIICLPQTIGSTTGGLVIQTIASLGNGPAALLFSEHIDSLAAAGVILADTWEGKRIVVVDQLGKDFLQKVKTGDRATVFPDGRVEIDSKD